MMRSLILILLSLSTLSAFAAEVYELQPPSWLLRDSTRSPLMPSQPLQADDFITSGMSGRVDVRLATEMRLRLGENAQIRIDQLVTTDNGEVNAKIEMLSGPIRVHNSGDIHQVLIGMPGEAVEIKGRGDVALDYDNGIVSVCLQNGRVSIYTEESNLEPLKMARVGHCYVRRTLGIENGEEAVREVFIQPSQMSELRSLTDDIGARPTLRGGSKWRVRLISSRSITGAHELGTVAGYAGFPVEVTMHGAGDDQRHIVMINNLLSENGAAILVNELKDQFGAGYSKVLPAN